MRFAPWTLVAVTLWVTLPAAAPADSATLGDEQTLQLAGLATDGPSLVDFFHVRAHAEADREHLQTLIHQLSDPVPAQRDRSAAELVAWGPLAVPVLRHAVNGLDNQEAAARAQKCLQSIEGPAGANLPLAAARLLRGRKLAGAAEVLLDYLPFADNAAVLQEVTGALCEVAYVNNKPEAVVVRALKDPVPVRRAAAGMALYRTDQPEQWPAVRKLLQDPKPAVRLRAAISLANAHDAEAITVLIDLFAELTPEQRKEAEEVLLPLAGEWAPGAIAGEDEIARRIRRDSWAAWWRNADGAALLAMIRKRTLTPENEKKIAVLIKKLGDNVFDNRERAQTEVVSLGRIALPLLREAIHSKDLEIARRADECIQLIEKNPASGVPAAAFRLLAVRKPEGAAEALLAYMPHIENEAQAEEVQSALTGLALRDSKPEPVLLAALEDKQALRRAFAGEALARGAGLEVRPAVRKLFRDADSMVRLRAGLALVSAHDREAVPLLIDLLPDLSAAEAMQAHEILFMLAGDKTPELQGDADAEARKKNRDAWAAWWKQDGDKVDLAKLDSKERLLGYTLIVDHLGRVLELGPDNKQRWVITGLANPIDAVVVPGNRVLIAEYGANKVTERDFAGKVLWEKAGLPGAPVNVQRLLNGNTFIATVNGLMEVDRTGKEVYTINTIGGVQAANKARDGSIWVLTNGGQCMRVDTTGKELKNFQLGLGAFVPAGIDLLPSGGVLIASQNNGKVVEVDAEGKVVWEAPAANPSTGTRLPNGNVLVGSYATAKVFEIDRKGKVIWEYSEPSQFWRARRR
jgi:HEAT repeat protein